ncbi:MAG: LytTR family DNA-binding domain-containing protein [Bacteroidales bacterium]|nr:LytTR family DNA-binding domain-containing protein [Bacteroidales bacterium]MDY6027346.1 LytTR family DNA-binding domain-containing protein [Prevotella sp.]
MTLKCAIIDDEPLAAELLSSYVKKTPELNLVGCFNSAVAAMKTLREEPADLLFLDIQMPELSGLEFAHLLPQQTRIVFTTAFDRYALDGYKVNAVDYLLKPISYKDFMKTVNKVINLVNREHVCKILNQDKYIYVKSDYKLHRVMFDHILYIEGVKDYVKFYVENERKSILSLMNMKNLEDYLPQPQFMRVHRSFIVNTQKISQIDRGRIVVNDIYIPVSESYKERVQNYLDAHTLQ